MSSNLWKILKGISDNLDLPELQILPYVPMDPASRPIAFVVPNDDIDLSVHLGGNDIQMEVKLTILTGAASEASAFELLYDFLDPTNARSIAVKIESDRTIGGVVDDCIVLRAESVGLRQLWDGWYAGADLILKVVKS